MPKKSPIDWHTRAKAVSMYRNGDKIREIEAALKITSGAIYNALRAWKVTRNRQHKEVTANLDAAAVAANYKKGASINDLSLAYGVSRSVIRRLILPLGIMRQGGFQVGGQNSNREAPHDRPEDMDVCSELGSQMVPGGNGMGGDLVGAVGLGRGTVVEETKTGESNVVDIHALQPHCTAPVRCKHCGRRWVAVWPVGCDFLECPGCGVHDDQAAKEAERPV